MRTKASKNEVLDIARKKKNPHDFKLPVHFSDAYWLFQKSLQEEALGKIMPDSV